MAILGHPPPPAGEWATASPFLVPGFCMRPTAPRGRSWRGSDTEPLDPLERAVRGSPWGTDFRPAPRLESTPVLRTFGPGLRRAQSLWHSDCSTRDVKMTQPLTCASRKFAGGARRSGAVCAWDAEPIAEPSLELLVLPSPMTNSAYLFGRAEESSARRAAAALISAAPGGLAASDDAVRLRPLVGLPADAGRPWTVSRAARPSRNERGRR